MSKLILSLVLLSVVLLFSSAPNAGAQTMCEFRCGPGPGYVPGGVAFAYKCEMNCPSCPEGNPECKACDRLEMVFGKELRCCSLLIQDCEAPPDF